MLTVLTLAVFGAVLYRLSAPLGEDSPDAPTTAPEGLFEVWTDAGVMLAAATPEGAIDLARKVDNLRASLIAASRNRELATRLGFLGCALPYCEHADPKACFCFEDCNCKGHQELRAIETAIREAKVAQARITLRASIGR